MEGERLDRMIKLGDIELPDDLIFDNYFEWTGQAAAIDRTLSGGVVVYANEISGRPINLMGDKNYAWLTFAQVKALQQMAGVIGGVYELIYGDQLFSVRFRIEDAPAIDVKPILDMPHYDYDNDEDYFYGTIKLMEV